MERSSLYPGRHKIGILSTVRDVLFKHPGYWGLCNYVFVFYASDLDVHIDLS